MNINRAEYDEWCGCRSLAQGTGWSPFELTRLGREVLDTSGCRSWKSCRKVIELGKQEYDGQRQTVCFITAVNDMLKSKAHLRPSSLPVDLGADDSKDVEDDARIGEEEGSLHHAQVLQGRDGYVFCDAETEEKGAFCVERHFGARLSAGLV